MRFSERYGYVMPSGVLKRESLDKEGIRGLCTCFDYLNQWFNQYDVNRHAGYDNSYTHLEESIWCFFMNRRKQDFWTGNGGHMIAATRFLESDKYEWYSKFDLVEYAIDYLRQNDPHDRSYKKIIEGFIYLINETFRRLNYAYRIVDDKIVAITDDEEIASIEDAISQDSAIHTHLSAALKHLSNRPEADYRNSIKESISAVEALCREITGESTLGDALKALDKKGIKIPSFLKVGFEKLYVYTNDQRTGIRHALMEATETPQYEEAKFMLIACSAFINYIQDKRSQLVAME